MWNAWRRQGLRRRMIGRLLAGTAVKRDRDTEELAREEMVAARLAWVDAVMADYRVATKRVDEAWMKALEPYDDWPEDVELPDLGEPPEQAEVDRLWALIADVNERGIWPRHLHWTV
jgi:hypothetical protein